MALAGFIVQVFINSPNNCFVNAYPSVLWVLATLASLVLEYIKLCLVFAIGINKVTEP